MSCLGCIAACIGGLRSRVAERAERSRLRNVRQEAERMYNIVQRDGHVFVTFGGTRVSEDYTDMGAAARLVLKLRHLFVEEGGEG